MDNAQRGDIVEIKKVHKTLSIVNNEFKIGVTKDQTKFKSESNLNNKIEKNVKQFRSKSIDYLAKELNLYCFAPQTLAPFSGVTLIFEFMLLVITLLISYRQKRKQQLNKQTFISTY